MPRVNDLSDQALLHGDLMATRRALVRALADAGGLVRDKSGRATSILFDRAGMGHLSSKGRIHQIAGLEADGWVLRDSRAKRTYEIVLVDDQPQVQKILRHFASLDEPEPEPEPMPELPKIPVGPPDWEEVAPEPAAPTADEVATAILRKVSTLLDVDVDELVSKDRMEEAIDARNEFSARLGVTVEENQRLRTRLRDVQDELAAVKAERDKLRKDKLQVEANLKAALRGTGGEVDAEVRRRIEAFMRQTPTTRGD